MAAVKKCKTKSEKLDEQMLRVYGAVPVAVAVILDDETIRVYQSATQRLLVDVSGDVPVVYAYHGEVKAGARS